MSDININIKVPAVEKLIDVTKSGFGAVIGPLLVVGNALAKAKADKILAKGEAEAIKTIAQAKAYSTKVIAQSQSKARDYLIKKQNDSPVKETIDIDMNTTDLIETKIQFQEEKRLSNIQSIVTQAKEKLPERVNNTPVDPDWIARFFQNAQDVSTEKMQQIWSFILAGEVETPGRTSLRTLDILKNMTKKEAELFDKVMKYKINDFVFNRVPEKYIKYVDLLFLEELGLANASPNINMDIIFQGTDTNAALGEYYGYSIIVHTESKNKRIQIPVFKFTQPAVELASFLHHTPDFGYLKLLARYLKEKESCDLKVGEILKKEGLELILKPESLKVIQP